MQWYVALCLVYNFFSKRLSAELSSSVASLPEGEVGKELRDALEREVDVREQLRFAEEDLKRTQLRLQVIYIVAKTKIQFRKWSQKMRFY